ncbi:hypothetical protein LTR50_000875 [Elasticomyces elasticus]|nr:hypothetical protein LTR50_000875 [Elasticomyces elasticus]
MDSIPPHSAMVAVLSAIPIPKSGRFWRRSNSSPDQRAASTHITTDGSRLQTAEQEQEEPDLKELNTNLQALVDLFPDIQPEVFREMLSNVSDESRVQVTAEMLLKDRKKWVQGRYRTPRKTEPRPTYKYRAEAAPVDAEGPALPRGEAFRSENYKKAVKAALYQEFKNLSHATIKAVLAEYNYSYTQARPTLLHLASKSWRFSISTLWTKRRRPAGLVADHPLIAWHTSPADERGIPYVKPSKSWELNNELYDTLIVPILDKQREEQLRQDQALATEMNDAEAEKAQALLDCECCFTPSAFEQISACDTSGHYICFRCIRHSVNEALFGQGWARNVVPEKTSLRCLAPCTDECQGCIPSLFVQRALSAHDDGQASWRMLEERAATDALLKSQLPLLRCPFCIYAEVDIVPDPTLKSLATLFSRMMNLAFSWSHVPPLLTILLLPISTMLLLSLYLFISLDPPFLLSPFRASTSRVLRVRRPLRFTCLSRSCSSSSCTRCLAPWRDPHTCFASQRLSLRHAIEAATTAAVKRTCPKCSLSFVKASGCNKLVCNCGYTMCYICRSDLGGNGGVQGQGYAHFCQHFRPTGGRCSECDRCDLYRVEDESVLVRRAAEGAEREWREKEGASFVSGIATGRDEKDKESFAGLEGLAREVLEGVGEKRWRWSWDESVDWVMDALLA